MLRRRGARWANTILCCNVQNNLGDCSLTGTIPASLAKLHSLEVLWLYNNDLHGHLPVPIGSPSCLPNLRDMDVGDNKRLGGTIDAQFLIRSKHCNTSGCHKSMHYPFLSGASLSSADINTTFRYAPMALVEERVQGAVAEIEHTHHGYLQMVKRQRV